MKHIAIRIFFCVLWLVQGSRLIAKTKPAVPEFTYQVTGCSTSYYFSADYGLREKDLADLKARFVLLGFGQDNKRIWITIIHIHGPTDPTPDITGQIIAKYFRPRSKPASVRPSKPATKKARGHPPRAFSIFKKVKRTSL
jgi:hypothetical protein